MKYRIVTLNPGNTAQWQGQLNDWAGKGYQLKQIVLVGVRNLAVFEKVFIQSENIPTRDFIDNTPVGSTGDANPIEETVTSEVMTAEVQ